MLFFSKLSDKKFDILLIIISCIMIALLYSMYVLPREYNVSTTLMLIEMNQNDAENPSINTPIPLTNKLLSTYSQIIKSDSTLSETLNKINNPELSLNQLKSKIQIKKMFNSDSFKVTVRDSNYEEAFAIEGHLIDVLNQNLKTFDVETYTLDQTHLESYEINSYTSRNVLIGIIIALLLSYVYIEALVELDKYVRNKKDVETEIGLKVLTEIPQNKQKKKKDQEQLNELYNTELDSNIFTKSFRKLRSNVQFLNVNIDAKNTILVTSANECEGKSLIAANIAQCYAEIGKKVIIIDADLRNGRQSSIFQVPNNLGLSNYLSNLDTNGAEITELSNKYICETSYKNINVITSGTVPPNPNEILASSRLQDIIKDLSVFYDVIIVDSTSVIKNIDPLILTRLVTSTILVADVNKLSKTDLVKSKKDIQNVGGRLVGIVLNRVKVRQPFKLKLSDIRFNIRMFFKNMGHNIKEFFKKITYRQKLLDEAKEQEITPEEENLQHIEEIQRKALEQEAEAVNVIEDEPVEEVISKKYTKQKKSKKSKKVEEPKEEPVVEEPKEEPELEKVEIKLLTNDDPTQEEEMDDIYEEESINTNIKTNFSFDGIKAGFRNFGSGVKNVFSGIGAKLVDIYTIKEEVKEVPTEETVNNDINDQANIKQEPEEEDFESLIRANIENAEKLRNETSVELNPTQKEEQPREVEPGRYRSKYAKPILNVEKKRPSLAYNENEENINENKTLVTIDTSTGFCKVVNKRLIIELPLNDIESVEGFIKSCYSPNYIKRFKTLLTNRYNLENTLTQNVDPLIYLALRKYDETLYYDLKENSMLADYYVYCMTIEYDKLRHENEAEYVKRCQELRIKELAKADLEIQYKLSNLRQFKKINYVNKRELKKYARNFRNEVLFKEEDEKKEKSVLGGIMETPQDGKGDNFIEGQYELSEFREQEKAKLEQERLRRDKERAKKEEKKKEQEVLKKIKREKQAQKKKEKEERLRKIREEKDLKRREERLKMRQRKEEQEREAKIQEDLLEDNLYPKTKNYKNM